MEIIGRVSERAELRRYYESGQPEFVAVYGRRRVGKTFLVKEFFKNDFSFSCTGIIGTSNKTQLNNFDVALIEYGSTDNTPSRDWFEAFRKLKDLLNVDIGTGTGAERKLIFIDELPWLSTQRSDFLNAFGYFWNTWASTNPRIMLIICGSATSWIVKKLFRDRGGLHNRVTGRLLLKPFTLHECEEFFQSRGIVMNRYQILESHMILGGVPYYLNLFDKSNGLSQNIDRLCFTSNALLKDEYAELYMSLFGNYERHMRIVETLATRSSGMTRDEISKAGAIPAGGHLSTALDDLEQCGFIDTYNDFARKKNGAYYQLIDPFTLFSLRFMRNNNTKDEYFWTNYQEDGGHRAWSGYAFEQICMLHLAQIKKKLGISGVSTSVSSWRSRNSQPGAQIDLVIDRRDGVINLCEMKYTKHPFTVDKATDESLQRKKAVFASEAKNTKALHTTLITTYGMERKAYFGTVQSEVTMDDLFAS